MTLCVHGEAARVHLHPAEVVSVDVMHLRSHVGGRRVADGGRHDVGQVLLEPVRWVLADLGAAGVVGVEAVNGAVVGDADQEGAAIMEVEERGDGLDRRRLQRLDHSPVAWCVRRLASYSRLVDSSSGPSRSTMSQCSWCATFALRWILR